MLGHMRARVVSENDPMRAIHVSYFESVNVAIFRFPFQTVVRFDLVLQGFLPLHALHTLRHCFAQLLCGIVLRGSFADLFCGEVLWGSCAE